jgi:hypothetical protein
VPTLWDPIFFTLIKAKIIPVKKFKSIDRMNF